MNYREIAEPQSGASLAEIQAAKADLQQQIDEQRAGDLSTPGALDRHVSNLTLLQCLTAREIERSFLMRHSVA